MVQVGNSQCGTTKDGDEYVIRGSKSGPVWAPMKYMILLAERPRRRKQVPGIELLFSTDGCSRR